MAANERQRAGGAGGDVFDVRVVAFAGGSAATLQALQDLFGLDREGAQRLVDSVPLVVRRAAPAHEAQSFVEALRGIGAQVALERPSNNNGEGIARIAAPAPLPRPAPGKPPPPPTAARPAPPPPKPTPGRAPPPPPRELEPLPRPIMRAATADLEFDFAGAGGDGFDEPKSSTQGVAGQGQGSRGRNEIEFRDAPDAGSLELDVRAVRATASDRTAAPTRTTVSERSAASRTLIAERTASLSMPASPAADSRGEHVGRLSNPDIARGVAGPMSRAAVVRKPGVEPKANPARRRQIALLRILGAIAIAAVGIQFDSSILWGNANLFSVLAHALAIYQIGVGLRGMAP